MVIQRANIGTLMHLGVIQLDAEELIIKKGQKPPSEEQINHCVQAVVKNIISPIALDLKVLEIYR